MDYNMYIYSTGSTYSIRYENLKQIAELDLIERYSIIRSDSLLVSEDIYSDFGREIVKLYGLDNDANRMERTISVVALGAQEYQRYLKEIGVKENKPIGILLDELKETINKKNYIGNMYNLKNHERLKGSTIVGNKNLEIEIIRSEKRPMGLERSYSFGGYLIVSDEIFDNLFEETYATMYVKAKDAKQLEMQIETLKKEKEEWKNLYANNIEEEIKQQNAMVLIVSIFLYGFITVISLIGITNIFNTITTNMNLRSKEFAMLKSIGMTKKEFNRMIRLESIFYGLKSLLIGIPLGLIGSYLIYKAFNQGLEFTYTLPVRALMIAILFVSTMIGIIMKYSLSKINKQNIIETIRNDNI